MPINVESVGRNKRNIFWIAIKVSLTKTHLAFELALGNYYDD